MSTDAIDPQVPVYHTAVRHLSRKDAVLKRLIARVGPCTLTPAPGDPFTVLVRCVIYQQISTKAARTIFDRLAARLGGVPFAPAAVAALSEADFRGCGVSGPKQRTVRALLDRLAAEPHLLAGIDARPDDGVRLTLAGIKGFGPWSVDMFLMFGISRLDILPVGDLGLKMGVRDEYGLSALPDAKELERMAEPWRPYRTVATWYFWRSRGPVPQSGQGG